MLKQQLLAKSPRPSEQWVPHPGIIDWIDSWAAVREDVLQALAAYQQAAGGNDINPFLALIDETDSALRLLKHRVDWLRDQPGFPDAAPIDRP